MRRAVAVLVLAGVDESSPPIQSDAVEAPTRTEGVAQDTAVANGIDEDFLNRIGNVARC